MSGSRHIVEVLGSIASGCESIAEAVLYDGFHSRSGARASVNGIQPSLARAIEEEIIPRLMLSHRQTAARKKKSRKLADRQIGGDEVAEFARICVQHDATVAQAYVEALMDQGATTETIFTGLFSPAALHFGELWESDRCTFSDVTIGLARIQQLIHEFSPFFVGEAEPALTASSALLVTRPGEQHSLGLLLVEEFFRRAGWSVWTPQGVSEEQLVTIISQERFDMVGISVTCDVEPDILKRLIARVRSASANRNVLVMVGGRLFNQRPEYLALVGADMMDADGRGAVQRVEALSGRLRTV